MKASRLIWTVVSLACLAGPGAVRGDEPEFMAVFLDDAKVGYGREQRTVAGGEVSHAMEMALSLGRAGVTMDVKIRDQTTETLDGQPLSFRRWQQLGPLGERVKSGQVKDGKIHLITTSLAGERRSVSPYPHGALMQEGMTRLLRKHGLKPGTKYSFIQLDLDSLKGLGTDVVVGRARSVSVIGRTLQLTPVSTTTRFPTGKIEGIAYVDDDFRPRKVAMSVVGMKLTLVACDEQYAHSPNGKFDLMAAVSVACPTAIPEPRSLAQAVFTLAPRGRRVELHLPTTGSQSVEHADDGTVTVRVKINPGLPGPRPYVGDDEAAREALEPNQFVESKHRAIVERSREIVGQARDALSAARAIESWVHEHISKDLTVGYASAAETLQSRTGDCTEHAVLTAALCRAAGVPCRIVAGVAYSEQFGGQKKRFIGHAWNQAYVGGTWVDLDASLGVDAARIALGVSAGDSTDVIGVMMSLGSFRVIEVDWPGRP